MLLPLLELILLSSSHLRFSTDGSRPTFGSLTLKARVAKTYFKYQMSCKVCLSMCCGSPTTNGWEPLTLTVSQQWTDADKETHTDTNTILRRLWSKYCSCDKGHIHQIRVLCRFRFSIFSPTIPIKTNLTKKQPFANWCCQRHWNKQKISGYKKNISEN